MIDIAAGSRVDRDYADLWRVNDGNWPAGSDGIVTLPVPATVGGYLSHASGSDSSGRLYPEDNTDTYVAPMVNGDRYVLQCFSSLGLDEDGLDVTLALDGTDDNSDACGSGGIYDGGSGNVQVTVSTNSDSGPLRYVLTIVPQGSLSTFDVRWPEPDLRVDEAIVTGPVAFASTLSSSGLRASSVMEVGRSIGPDTWHVRRDEGVNALSARSTGASDPRAETIEWIRGMREDFGLEVDPNYLLNTATVPGNDPYYNTTNDDTGLDDNWNLKQIKVDTAWTQIGTWGQDVGVAIMDTGLYSTDMDNYGSWHEDLAANVVVEGGLLDFVSADYDVDDDTGRDGNPATPPTPGAESTSYHGTHVAGIVAAEDNSLGTVGIAHQATILPYRVLGVDPVTGDDGTGAVSDLIDAINNAVDRNGNAEGGDDVDVINLSLGGLPPLLPVQTATDRAYDDGILVVAAGGNSGDASAVYPAANRRVVGVGATNRSGELASYSNYGQSVDLLAPGGALDDGILNAYGEVDGEIYGYLAGTSMAVPHLSGVYALVKGVNPGLTPDQFRAQMIARNLTTMMYTYNSEAVNYSYASHGAGLLDADAALQDPTAFPTVVSAWPRVLEISSSGNESTVLLEILKDDAENVPVVSGEPMIPDSFEMTDGDGQAIGNNDPIPESLRIRVDPDALPPSREVSGNIEIEHTAENGSTRTLIVPVYVQSTDEQEDRSAGRHYVLLLDADDFNSSRSMQVVAREDNGEYEYSMDGVTPGDYILVAGTDLDSNGFICENGEACAEYPSAGSREVISISEGETLRLDMTTSFRRPTIAEMGLPRYGFEGYPVPDRSTGDTSVDRQLK
ncbi:S8 family serine peptidase [Marinobacter sp. M1N3S26]|uniref:S8 family serine peptidase n=1 Tax=Marinobacter sp. M1N3S26 TaxID=3382299 RepID=UPI00387AECC1